MLKRPPAGDGENRPFMEGEGKRGYSQNGKGEKKNLNPGHIQEYDFFVTQDGDEDKEVAANQPAEVEKKRGRKRSKTLFFSE
jgi:hypothetical protein